MPSQNVFFPARRQKESPRSAGGSSAGGWDTFTIRDTAANCKGKVRSLKNFVRYELIGILPKKGFGEFAVLTQKYFSGKIGAYLFS